MGFVLLEYVPPVILSILTTEERRRVAAQDRHAVITLILFPEGVPISTLLLPIAAPAALLVLLKLIQ